MVDYSSRITTDLMTLETAAYLFAQISPETYTKVFDVVPEEKVPEYLLALIPQLTVRSWKVRGCGAGTLDEFLSDYKRARAAINRSLSKEFAELPVERLLSVRQDGFGSFDEYLKKIGNIIDQAGGLNIPEIASLILLAQGASEAEIFSRFQSQWAKNPRNRKPSPSSAAMFVGAVRKESKKQRWNTAWEWLEVDKQFHGFDVIKLDTNSIQYRHNGKDCKPITKDTFQRRWQEAK